MIKIDIRDLKSQLQISKKIIVIPHKNPDGDAIGSCVALNELLKSLGHKSLIISPNNFPDFLKWMDVDNEIKIYEDDNKLLSNEILNSDIIFTLDFNALSRIGPMGDFVKESKAFKVMIDHHQNPENYAKYIYSDVNMSSTCEMVYHFISELSLEDKVTSKIASALYTGIMTDTGSFKFPLTTDLTHKVVSELIKKGANGNQINNLVYDNNSYDKLLLLSHTLSNMVVDMQHKTAYMYLTQQNLNKYNFKKGCFFVKSFLFSGEIIEIPTALSLNTLFLIAFIFANVLFDAKLPPSYVIIAFSGSFLSLCVPEFKLPFI